MTVDYFPHPVKNGTRMFVLEQKYGVRGYAAYYKILELLGSSEGHFIDYNEGKHQFYFAAQLQCDVEESLKILQTMADIGAIDKEIWNDKKVIWNQEFVDKLSELYSRRQGETPSKESIISANINHAQDDLCGISANIKRQSKVKYSKEKESKGEQTNSKELELAKTKNEFKKTLEPFLNNPYSANTLNDFYGYWTEPNKSKTKVRFELEKTWDVGRRLQTWSRNETKFSKNGKHQFSNNRENLEQLATATGQFLTGNQK